MWVSTPGDRASRSPAGSADDSDQTRGWVVAYVMRGDTVRQARLEDPGNDTEALRETLAARAR